MPCVFREDLTETEVMKFGQLPSKELGRIDFSLPAEPVGNSAVLKLPRKQQGAPLVYVGCAKWGRKEWVGKLYPKGTPERAYLDEYVRHYNAIELNATHYKIYSPAAVRKWADKAGSRDFRFCPKLPQSISHYSSFINAQAQTDAFLESILAFGPHLGPIFIQVPESYSPAQAGPLFTYLESLPRDLHFFLEVRHPAWFADKAAGEMLWKKLRELGVGAVITDTAGRRDCAHMHLTVRQSFIRFVGNSLHATDYTRIDEWVDRIALWLRVGLEELYFFMHMHDEAHSPELTVYLIGELNKKCGLSLQQPRLLEDNELPFPA